MTFLRREFFEITESLERNAPKIRREFVEFMGFEGEDMFLPYPGYGQDWKMLMVYASKAGSTNLPKIDGKLIENQEDETFFPVTRSIVRAIPGVLHAGFSNLGPGASIRPHKDPNADMLRCHLGVMVPEPELCGLRVEGRTKKWAEGRCLVFDENTLHEAWNHGSAHRIVLIVDFERDSAASSDARTEGMSAFEPYGLVDHLARGWQNARWLYARVRHRTLVLLKILLGRRSSAGLER